MGRTPAGQTREKIYRFVRTRLLEGRPPTVREVQARFGFKSPQSAREHLERLVEEGRLAKESGRARGYRLPGGHSPTALVPVLGRVAAGELTTAVEDLEGYVPVDLVNIGGRPDADELFGLRVKGDSMRDAAILEGDLVIVRRQSTARSGDIVVALVEGIEGEATVKTLVRRGRRVELHPANPDYDVIRPDPAQFSLLGKVIEVRRQLR
ncbi:MAG: transcriptional repressor LexA [Planctomycetota bacterium]|jgi:repressor LexA